MTAADVVDRAKALGITLNLGDDDLIHYRGQRSAIESLLPDLRVHASAIAAVLRERAPVPTASEAVESAARLLACRWAAEPPVCAFLVGAPGEGCRRCGASWIEHYAPGEQIGR